MKTVSSFRLFTIWLESVSEPSIRFRGVTDKNFDLRPKIGRLEYRGYCNQNLEKKLLSEFRRHHFAHMHSGSRNPSDWELAMLGRHHGLPTRLLDWTKSPLVAAFFAAEDGDSKKDGAIYYYDSATTKFPDLHVDLDGKEGRRYFDIEKTGNQ